jgi:hypothetical protein
MLPKIIKKIEKCYKKNNKKKENQGLVSGIDLLEE